MINWEKFRPILVVPAVPNDDGISFLCQDEQLDIDGEIVPILWKILSFCNGYRTVMEITELSNIEIDLVKNILIELLGKELINDSCEQYRNFHNLTNYPARYICSLDEDEIINLKNSKRKPVKEGQKNDIQINKESILYRLQLKRKSCRSFSEEKKLTLFQLGNICVCAYSLIHHATPSGGGLYPLKLYCIVTSDQVDFKAGYYEYDSESDSLILYKENIDLEQLKYCFNDGSLAFNSPVQIVIGADLSRQAYKYSNRGYRLSLIEVGQVAQNISLCCEELGLASCELGGVLDKPLSKELEINDDDINPILAVAIGYPSDKKIFKYDKFLSVLADKYVGENKPVESFGINNLDIEDSSFYGAWAKYGMKTKRFSGATALSYNEAVCKAIIEGYERYRSGIVRVDYIGPAQNKKEFFKPEELVPLTEKQRSIWNLPNYHDGDCIEWTKDMTGKYFLPTDFVYYGHGKKNKLFFSDSSGISAYSNYDEAKKRAVAELIERDAIMRSWYQQKSPQHINFSILPQHIKNRIKHWEGKGRKVHVLDLQSNYLPVFLVVITGSEYPCFVSGAAASIGNANEAMLKALQEAEYNLLLAIDNPIDKKLKAEEVKTPHDHGHFYHFYENAEKLSWLWSNEKKSSNYYSDSIDFNKIINDLEVAFVDLSESEDADIKVVRAVSRKIVPIGFGYQRDYYLHPALKNIKINPKSREIPHYFA